MDDDTRGIPTRVWITLYSEPLVAVWAGFELHRQIERLAIVVQYGCVTALLVVALILRGIQPHLPVHLRHGLLVAGLGAVGCAAFVIASSVHEHQARVFCDTLVALYVGVALVRYYLALDRMYDRQK